MQHQLGRISIIAWQDRRFHDAHRPGSLSVFLAIAIVASVLPLVLHFAFGTQLPIEALQVAFAVLVASIAFISMRAMVAVILRLQRP